MLKRLTSKISYVVASLVLLTAQITPFFVFAPKAGATNNGKVRICHATGSNSNPYTENIVDENAVDGSGGGDHNRSGHQNGEDIIPPTYTDGSAGYWDSRNWDAEGQAIWNNGCKIPKGSIKIVKDAQPNSTDDFDFTVKKGSTTIESFELEDDGDNNDSQKDNKTIDDLTAGTYVVTESPEESGWVLHDIVCTGGNDITKDVANKKVTIVLAANENAVCTFINKPAPTYGEVKVNKYTDLNGDGDYNDNNEKNNSTANSLGFRWGLDAEPVDNDMGTTQSNVPTGAHTVAENSVSGYELVGWHKSGDNKSCDRNLPVTVDVKKNEKTEITLCNRKIPKGTLVLIKEVKNDNGGTAMQSAWTLNANGPEAVSGIDSTTSTDTGYSKDVAPGVYVLSETNGPAGYELDSIKCKIDSGNWFTLDSKKEAEVKSGKTTKCVFKNDDKAPTLQLKKVVVNDNGGVKYADDWTLRAKNGDSYLINEKGSPADQSYALTGKKAAKAGVSYELSETGPAGYKPSAWTCNGNELQGNVVVLELGEDVTCIIVNDDQPAKIVATKIVCDDEALLPNLGAGGPTNITSTTAIDWVTNNSGCKLASGWSFEYAFNNASNPGDNQEVGGAGWTVFGSTDANGQASTEISDLSNVDRIWVREQLQDGYLGFSYNVAGNNNNDVSAELYCNQDVLNYDNYDFIDNPAYGNTYYCVAWNVQQAKIRVHKEVKNNDGGKLKSQDFKFTVNGQNAQNFATAGNYVEFNVNPGDYTISEVANSAYSVSYKGCKIKALPGKVYNCYVKNNDKPGKIVVHKKVINNDGGTKKAKDFKYKINYGNWTNFNYSGTNFETVNAGKYTITEKEDSGYDTTYSKDCKNVFVKNGETKYCYITNNDKKSYVFIDKDTNPYNVSDEFHFTVINNGVSQGIPGFTSDGRGQTAIKPGSVVVEEPQDKIPAGWFKTYENCWKTKVVYKENGVTVDHFIDGESVGTSFRAKLGQNYRCQFTNEKGGKVTVTKVNDVNNNGEWDEGEETLSGWDMVLNPDSEQEGKTQTTNNEGQAVFANVKPGGYTVDEVQQEGWSQTFKYCDSGRVELSRAEVSDENGYGNYFWVSPESETNCYIGNYTPTIITDIEPVCKNNFPYLKWSVRANGFVPTQFKIEWFTVAGNDAGTPADTLVHTQTFTPASAEVDYDGTTYSATTLWPGANDSATNSDWPGWKLVNGTWVKDPSDFGGNLRPKAKVALSVNPTTTEQVSYPPATPACDPNPPTGSVLGASTTLASTGIGQLTNIFAGLAIISLAIFLSLFRKTDKQ